MHIQIYGLQNIPGSVYNNTGIYAYILDMNPHNPPRQLESLTFYNKRSVTIRREICPIRAEISTHKHGEKLYISYLYD